MAKPLFLFVGKSSSGKTTIADILENQYGLVQARSYTTRLPRYDGEIGHVFINEDEFDKLENIVAYTKYDGHRYCATADQLDQVSIYVVDVPGVTTLLDKYQSERPIVIFYFDTSVPTRIDRMIERHDSDMAIISRLYVDEGFDWENELNKLVWHHKNNLGRNVTMHVINANEEVKYVLSKISNIINDAIENQE